jgi:outer membrane autotransporter protein
MRYHTGSYVDNKGWGISAGFARKVTNQQGELLFGPLIEYGQSSYDSYLDNGTHGSGDSHYTGAGIFARQTAKNGCYYEGSLRVGSIASDYSSHDMEGADEVHYDTSAPYYGLHFGLGKITKIGHGDSFDTYGRYFYSHQNGSSADLSSGEHYDFSSVDSHRLRLGARYTKQLHPDSRLYIGLAYQYEFGGDARATYQGESTPSPSLKGGSGMLELGWQIKPVKESPVTLDFGFTGWTGRQQGVSFNAGMNWAF